MMSDTRFLIRKVQLKLMQQAHELDPSRPLTMRAMLVRRLRAMGQDPEFLASMRALEDGGTAGKRESARARMAKPPTGYPAARKLEDGGGGGVTDETPDKLANAYLRAAKAARALGLSKQSVEFCEQGLVVSPNHEALCRLQRDVCAGSPTGGSAPQIGGVSTPSSHVGQRSPEGPRRKGETQLMVAAHLVRCGVVSSLSSCAPAPSVKVKTKYPYHCLDRPLSRRL